jgi:hypothetical protein
VATKPKVPKDESRSNARIIGRAMRDHAVLAVQRSVARLISEIIDVRRGAVNEGDPVAAIRKLDRAFAELRGVKVENLARMSLIAAIDDAVRARAISDPDTRDGVVPRDDYERELLDEVRKIEGHNDFVESLHLDGQGAGYTMAPWPDELLRAAKDPAAYALDMLASSWPEYAANLTLDDLRPAIDAWGRRGRPLPGSKPKWSIVVALITKAGLDAPSATSLKSAWSRWKPGSDSDESASDEHDLAE